MSLDFGRLLARAACWIAAALLCVACNPTPARDVKRPEPPRDERVSVKGLTIYGYNYTDKYIYSFEVNGTGGGNLEVSTPTAGGSKSVCCATVYPPLIPYDVTIKWKARTGKDRWCEKKVKVTGPIPPNPKYFEVHFYQDGKIQVAVTEEASEPRVKLERVNYAERYESGNTVNDEKAGVCRDGYR